jgi:hypothetical protein
MCDRALTMHELCLEAVRLGGTDIKAIESYVRERVKGMSETQRLPIERRDCPRPGFSATCARKGIAALGFLLTSRENNPIPLPSPPEEGDHERS